MKNNLIINMVFFILMHLIITFNTILEFKIIPVVVMFLLVIFYVNLVQSIKHDKLRMFVYSAVYVLSTIVVVANRIHLSIKNDVIRFSSLKLFKELLGVKEVVYELFDYKIFIVALIPVIAIILTLKFGNKGNRNFCFKTFSIVNFSIICVYVFAVISNPFLVSNPTFSLDYTSAFGLPSYYLSEAVSYFDNDHSVEGTIKTNNDDLTDYVSKEHGMFKDKKNVVFVVAESLDKVAIDKELTPTLYKMATDGVYFENYFTTTQVTKSSEYSVLTSLAPPIDYTSISEYSEEYTTLPKIFKENGFCTFASHGNTKEYYDRQTIYKDVYGFDYSYFSEDLNLKNQGANWIKDVDVFDKTVSNIEKYNCDKTFNFNMSITGHSTYDSSKRDSLLDNLSDAKNVYPEYDNNLLGYFSAQMFLEEMLVSAVDYYTQQGEINDTVFVVVSDHYPYSLLNETSPSDTYKNMIDDEPLYRDNVPFIIYDPTQKLENNLEFGSNIDVLPTIVDLFGFDSDLEFAQGVSFFNQQANHEVNWNGFVGFSYASKQLIYNDRTKNSSGDVSLINEVVKSQMEFSSVYNKLYEEKTE